MATITLPNGVRLTNLPDNLSKERYDEIVTDAVAKLANPDFDELSKGQPVLRPESEPTTPESIKPLFNTETPPLPAATKPPHKLNFLVELGLKLVEPYWLYTVQFGRTVNAVITAPVEELTAELAHRFNPKTERPGFTPENILKALTGERPAEPANILQNLRVAAGISPSSAPQYGVDTGLEAPFSTTLLGSLINPLEWLGTKGLNRLIETARLAVKTAKVSTAEVARLHRLARYRKVIKTPIGKGATVLDDIINIRAGTPPPNVAETIVKEKALRHREIDLLRSRLASLEKQQDQLISRANQLQQRLAGTIKKTRAAASKLEKKKLAGQLIVKNIPPPTTSPIVIRDATLTELRDIRNALSGGTPTNPEGLVDVIKKTRDRLNAVLKRPVPTQTTVSPNVGDDVAMGVRSYTDDIFKVPDPADYFEKTRLPLSNKFFRQGGLVTSGEGKHLQKLEAKLGRRLDKKTQYVTELISRENEAINTTREIFAYYGSRFHDFMEDLPKGVQFSNIMEGARGTKQLTELNGLEQRLVPKLRELLDDFGQFAARVGVTIKGSSLKQFQLVKNYVPRRLPEEEYIKLIQGLEDLDTPAQAAEWILRNKYVNSLNQAEILYKALKKLKTAPRPASLYERTLKATDAEIEKQFGIKFLNTPDVIQDYLSSMSHYLGRTLAYGEKNQKLLYALDQLGVEYGFTSKLYKRAHSMVKKILKHPDTRIKPLETLRTLNMLKFSLSTRVLQTGQRLLAGSQSVNQLINNMTAASKRRALRLGGGITPFGGVLDDFIRVAKKQDNFLEKLGTTNLKLLGIDKADFKARQTALLVGEKLTNKAFNLLRANPNNTWARKFLTTYGVHINVNDALKAGKLTAEQVASTARMFDKAFNFYLLISDLPRWMSGPWGRTVFQWKAPAYMHLVLMKNQLMLNALSGPQGLWNLFMLTLALATAGEMYGTVKDLQNLANPLGDYVDGPLRPNIYRPGWDKPAQRLLNNTVTGGGLGLGLLSDVITDLAITGNPLETAAQFVLGVNYSQGRNALEFSKELGDTMIDYISGKRIRDDDIRRLLKASTRLPLVPQPIGAPVRGLLTTPRDIQKQKRNLQHKRIKNKRLLRALIGQ